MTDATKVPALPDAEARARALSVEDSFIVQAPAGSGKTELLTLRYLSLLAVCQEPEEVLAITFTRKAASEMQNRILGSLRWAQGYSQENPLTEADPLSQQRYRIAKAVLDKDGESSWGLLANPARLRVKTIDSFCFYLAQQLPILSRLGGSPQVDDDSEAIYEHAVQALLSELEGSSELATDLETLVSALDNNLQRAEKLLVQLLSQRDQWLPYLMSMQETPDEARRYLHQSAEELLRESMDSARQSLGGILAELSALVDFAANHLLAEKVSKVISASGLQDIRDSGCDLSSELRSYEHWQLLLHLLITGTGQWRRQVNKSVGFPAASSASGEQAALFQQHKSSMESVLEELSTESELLATLNFLRLLPNPTETGGNWPFLDALSRVLIRLGGQLMLSFNALGRVDHSQISTAARNALGDNLAPTDLALRLDHRLSHILVDEFQDTSQLQLELLLQLTQGWQRGDGRSVFLVGDAMQSCYGFRNANVGIYLRVRSHGLGDLPLESLTLRANFRSQAHVVNWVNDVFSHSFPAKDDSARAAVSYSASAPMQAALDGQGIETRIVGYDKGLAAQANEHEAALAVDRVEQLRSSDPGSSIAILVRGRSHLQSILPELRRRRIPYQATDIDRLGSQPIIDDLISLTKAVINPADSLSWYALLRSPWCALSNTGLLRLRLASREFSSLWCFFEQHSYLSEAQYEFVSPDELGRLKGFIRSLRPAMGLRFRIPLVEVVRDSWLRLRGPSLLQSDKEKVAANQFFDMLMQQEQGFGLADAASFEEQVRDSFVDSPQSESEDTASHDKVQLLTMHKSKGLEFDHVILPALGRRPPPDSKPLLLWHERMNTLGDNRLFLAARPSEQQEDALYRFIRHEQALKSSFEDTRLLYIAVTRARRSALLLATIEQDAEAADLSPAKNSLIERIWPTLQSRPEQLQLQSLTADPGDGANSETAKSSQLLRCSTLTPVVNESLLEACALVPSAETEEEAEAAAYPETHFGLVERKRRALVGTLVHRALEDRIKGRMPEIEAGISQRTPYWRQQLRNLDLSAELLRNSVEQIAQQLRQSFADKEAEWLFAVDSNQRHSELTVTDELNKRNVVDLTLIDETDTRWIIDFKSSLPEPGEDENQFCERMKADYVTQLARYRRLFRQMEDRTQRCALYLSAIPRLVEIQEDEFPEQQFGAYQ